VHLHEDGNIAARRPGTCNEWGKGREL